MQETIAAISTPFGEGAIALIRVSGPASTAIAGAAFRSKRRPSELPARFQQFGQIIDDDGEILDDVLLTVFHAPASYTGEEMVEIACHGGILVTRRVLNRLVECGARIAAPGEFTQRAFLNGKLDLTQAEAVMDLIKAQSDLALRAAAQQLEGRLGERVRAIKEELLHLLAHVEACIDFPEEDIAPDTSEAMKHHLTSMLRQIDLLLRTAGQGRVLRHGARTVICGAPNVGKSSLLNLLLGHDRAIVSEIPGTTRDSIEEVINLRGIPLRLVDTAGIRDSSDAIENQGIARTMRHIEEADLVLHLADASGPPDALSKAAIQEPDHRRLFILNKIDLGEDPGWSQFSPNTPCVRLSCKERQGMDALADAIYDRVLGHGTTTGDLAVAINVRHQDCLKRAGEFLRQALLAFEKNISPEFIAMELRSALDAVGDIVGRAGTEELLGRIFSTFCLGK